MRKMLALFAAAGMMAGLCACGGNGGGQTTAAGTAAAAETSAASAAAEESKADSKESEAAEKPEAAAAETEAKEQAAESKKDGPMKVGMVTDIEDINDQSFNQTTYEACKAYCDLNGLDFTCYLPEADSREARDAKVEQAVKEGCNVLVLPGYAFAGTVVDCTEKYPDVKFLALDISGDDILSEALGGEYDGRQGYWNVKEYYHEDNVFCAVYQEELAGYMAGTAAVKMGFRKLGFLGGKAVPAVVRYGCGFVQGANDAASELGLDDVEVRYVYGNQYYGDADITAAMDQWYQEGTECVFACGGGIVSSAAEAAQKAGGKIIGVDVDQKGALDGKYGAGITVTSAMKGLAATVNTVLSSIQHGEWDQYRGKILRLGLVSGDDPVQNYVQLPMNSTMWNETFTKEDYQSLVAGLFDEELHVSDSTSSEEPKADHVRVRYEGVLK